MNETHILNQKEVPLSQKEYLFLENNKKQDAIIEKQDSKIKELTDEKSELLLKIKNLQKELDNSKAHHENSEESNKELEAMLEDTTVKNQVLKNEIEKNKKEIAIRDSMLIEKNKKLDVYQKEVEGLNNSIVELEDTIEEYEYHKQQLNKQLKEGINKDAIIVAKAKRIGELERSALSESDLLFFYSCKADLILCQFFKHEIYDIAEAELKEQYFPAVILEQTKTQPFETTNYTLTYNNNSYHLKKRKK